MPSLTNNITPSPLPFRSILHTVEYSWIKNWYVGKFASIFVSLMIRISILLPMSDKKQFKLIPYGIYIKMSHDYFTGLFNLEIFQSYNYVILVFIRTQIHGDRFRFWSGNTIKTTSADVNFFVGVQKTLEVTNSWNQILR